MAGTQGPRMMFGPGRLVNHDCNPNSQLRHIPKTHSYQFITICPIALGESITVQYTAQGGFGSSGTAPEGTKCLCATCNPTNPPTLKRRSPPPPLVSAKLKPTRRMKKRLKRLVDTLSELLADG
ncbi:hypothetical protein JAAARDRAFT_655628 [Jaapia argillacea MUCL 33604]|uniref:SET domain-containing protein n=1 Tax=Jaapia argillacea MUCL 33604 TaxID=933084 RepID=A0A067PZ74_9AGAM|nr:hypothetical protein JAAARDRAFT_655628 [Jaapia argillacea MUCL 33604]